MIADLDTITVTIHPCPPKGMGEWANKTTTKAFKLSPRGLLAAARWADEECSHLRQTLGNLAYPTAAFRIGPVAVADTRSLMDDLLDIDLHRRTVANASKVIENMRCTA